MFAPSLNVKQFCFNSYIGPYQVLPLQIKVDVGTITMKECSTFLKASALRSLTSYPVHLFWEVYSSAETQSVYSTDPANRAFRYLRYIRIYVRKIDLGCMNKSKVTS